MVRDFNRDFEGKCCEDDFGVCDWTCDEISRRINTRAPIGSVYTRSETDTRIQAIEAIATAALNIVHMQFAAGVPPGTGALGDIYVDTTNAPDYDVYFSDGTAWRLVVDWSEFINRITDTGATGNTIDITDIMQKSVYDDPLVGSQNDRIGVQAGGLNDDNSSTSGIVIFQGGNRLYTNNHWPLEQQSLASDEILVQTDNPVQIIETSTDIDVVLPVLPNDYVHFRIINKLKTNVITVRDDVGGNIVYTLEAATTYAADFHYDGTDWNVIALNLV